MRDGFIFYRSFYESAKALPNEERLELFEAIFEYGLNLNETENKPMVTAFLNLMKPQIDANNRRYENGKKGGRPPKKTTIKKQNNNQNETKQEPKEKEKENVKDKEKDISPSEIISKYKNKVSDKQDKVRETKSFNLLIRLKEDYEKILIGLDNYKCEDEKYCKSLPNFLEDKTYLDYLKEKKPKQGDTKTVNGNSFVYFEGIGWTAS